MCDIQNNGKIQREFETRSTDDQPTIQWLPVVGSWTFLGVNMHFYEKLFMCDSCNFLVRAYLHDMTPHDTTWHDRHLRGGHDAEDGEQDHREQRGGGDGEELAQPVARHQQQHVQTPGLWQHGNTRD